MTGTEHIFMMIRMSLPFPFIRAQLSRGAAIPAYRRPERPFVNMNIPYTGRWKHRLSMADVVLPKLRAFNPDIVVVACGFDASGVDPLADTLGSS